MTRAGLVDDGEFFDDDARDLSSYNLQLNVPYPHVRFRVFVNRFSFKEVLEFKERPERPLSSKPLVILQIFLESKDHHINLRIPIYSRDTKVSEVLSQLLERIRNMNNPSKKRNVKQNYDT